MPSEGVPWVTRSYLMEAKPRFRLYNYHHEEVKVLTSSQRDSQADTLP